MPRVGGNGGSGKISIVMTWLLFVCGALLLFTNAAFGDETYQRTRDGKTIVWNENAGSGDEAAWSGDRDREGYANGFGTLTWYTTRQKGERGSAKSVVYARYWGNMVRGKFDGPVNVHSKGRTDHAIFTNGKRTTRWAAGTAPSRNIIPQSVAPSRPLKEKAEVANAESPQGSTPKSLREQAPKTLVNSEITSRASSEGVREQSPPAEGPVAQEKSEERSQRLVVRPPADTATSSVGEEAGSQKPEVSSESRREQGPGEQKSEMTEMPLTQKKSVTPTTSPSGESVHEPGVTKKSRAEADEALRTLVGPPASLRPDTLANMPSTNAPPEAAPSPTAGARLTREEVIDAAGAEARRRGYDPTEYIRGEPEYKAADEVWSVSYDQIFVDETAETAKHFSVTVDDKTKGIVFVPGK
jgi:hypothetical protein